MLTYDKERVFNELVRKGGAVTRDRRVALARAAISFTVQFMIEHLESVEDMHVLRELETDLIKAMEDLP